MHACIHLFQQIFTECLFCVMYSREIQEGTTQNCCYGGGHEHQETKLIIKVATQIYAMQRFKDSIT